MASLDGFLLVGAGGAIGAIARYAASLQFGARPLTTFGVNVSGALLIGVVAGSTIGAADSRWRLFLATGILGGYTTFSTLALEALISARSSGWQSAALNLGGSAIAGLAAAAAGVWIGSRWTAA